MNKMLSSFIHRRGNHCGSSSISLLLKYYGHEVSEPMCLGLGAGIDFFYIADASFSPTHYWMGRGPTLEMDCFARLGVPVRLRRTADAAEAWRWVKDEIDADRPALLQVDIRWLDYYHTQTHFGGHKILIVGYDEERQLAWSSDNEFPELQTVPLAGLVRARAETSPIFDLQNDWFETRMPAALTPLEQAVPPAIAEVAQRMMSDRGGVAGLAALERAAHEMADWGRAKDWAWSARFCYQVIEKRGTGGGHFRKMYADFLKEAAPYCPLIEQLNLVSQMQAVAAAWTELAYLLREISEREQPQGFDRAAQKLRAIHALERDYYQAALGCRCLKP